MQQFAALLRKDSRPVRYLVVDDSVFARKNLIKMIEMFGGEVAGEAGDGLTAIAEFNRTKPDIVLMDITMPQMEGIEAVERIVRQHSDARIVMVSSVGYQENILAALQKGAKHFVQKPVKPEVLYEILRYVLSDDPSAANAPIALAGEPDASPQKQPSAITNVRKASVCRPFIAGERFGPSGQRSSSVERVGRPEPSADLLRQLDDNPLRAADVAEPIAVFVALPLANELGAAGSQASDDGVDVVDC